MFIYLGYASEEQKVSVARMLVYYCTFKSKLSQCWSFLQHENNCWKHFCQAASYVWFRWIFLHQCHKFCLERADLVTVCIHLSLFPFGYLSVCLASPTVQLSAPSSFVCLCLCVCACHLWSMTSFSWKFGYRTLNVESCVACARWRQWHDVLKVCCQTVVLGSLHSGAFRHSRIHVCYSHMVYWWHVDSLSRCSPHHVCPHLGTSSGPRDRPAGSLSFYPMLHAHVLEIFEFCSW